jgi:hypothetical protein|mmetsp:Transcript_98973/g.283144  ORF Transcript_98973/g.283144 Transcript_98973/m.283144 type:complete len:110 (-) Transcript_98973:259-588(-)
MCFPTTYVAHPSRALSSLSPHHPRLLLLVQSMDDMSEYFSRLDQAANASQMDAMFANTRSRILCNDCGSKSIVQYRLMHHKCPRRACGSYNTRVVETMVLRPGAPEPTS